MASYPYSAPMFGLNPNDDPRNRKAISRGWLLSQVPALHENIFSGEEKRLRDASTEEQNRQARQNLGLREQEINQAAQKLELEKRTAEASAKQSKWATGIQGLQTAALLSPAVSSLFTSSASATVPTSIAGMGIGAAPAAGATAGMGIGAAPAAGATAGMGLTVGETAGLTGATASSVGTGTGLSMAGTTGTAGTAGAGTSLSMAGTTGTAGTAGAGAGAGTIGAGTAGLGVGALELGHQLVGKQWAKEASHHAPGGEQEWSTGETMATRAGEGALIGSMFGGGAGAGVGAVIGAIVGFVESCICFGFLYGPFSPQVRYARIFCGRYMDLQTLYGYYGLGEPLIKLMKKSDLAKRIVEKYMARPFFDFILHQLGRKKKISLWAHVFSRAWLKVCKVYSIISKQDNRVLPQEYMPCVWAVGSRKG